MRQYTAGENEHGMRLSRFVQHVTSALPTSLMYKAFRNKRIKVNGKKAVPDATIQQGDIIELYINDEFFVDCSQAAPASKSAPPLITEWQNASIAILYKPAGILCHSDNTGDATLLDSFTAQLVQSGEYNPQKQNTFAPALCNRIDRGTEGLVIGAKSYAALRDMNAAIQQKQVIKTYLCITAGTPPQGLHTAYLLRDMNSKTVSISPQQKHSSKQILTEVEVLEKHSTLALCRVTLHTGRTHQIRAHLAYLGAPLLGDKKYGNPAYNQHYNATTQALCAWQLRFSSEAKAFNSISSLADQTIEATHATLPTLWQAIKKG